MRCSPCAIPPQLPDKQGLHQAVSPKPLYPTPLGHLLAVPPPSLIFVLVPAQGQEIFPVCCLRDAPSLTPSYHPELSAGGHRVDAFRRHRGFFIPLRRNVIPF